MLKFVDEAHENFVKDKYLEFKKYGMTDVYYSSLIYTLGICETTREHFDEIYERGEGINIDCLQSAWQTGTSEKVVRMAFSLWNRCMYDSEEDRKNDVMSSSYNPSEIFCCSYAPYFYEAIKIRYPEYTESQEKENITVASYTRIGKKEQLNNEEDEEEM